MKKMIIMAMLFLAVGSATAASEKIKLYKVTGDGIGDIAGTVTLDETPYGLRFTPDLKGLSPGIHGFHVHAKGSCEPEMKEGKKWLRQQRGDILTRITLISTLGCGKMVT